MNLHIVCLNNMNDVKHGSQFLAFSDPVPPLSQHYLWTRYIQKGRQIVSFLKREVTKPCNLRAQNFGNSVFQNKFFKAIKMDCCPNVSVERRQVGMIWIKVFLLKLPSNLKSSHDAKTSPPLEMYFFSPVIFSSFQDAISLNLVAVCQSPALINITLYDITLH